MDTQKVDNPPKLPCPALPPGWLRQVVQRRSGLSAGKCDVYYYSPSGEKLRSKFQLGLRLGNEVDISRFDYLTGEMAVESVKEKVEGSSSPMKRKGTLKTENPKQKKKDKIVVKFRSSVFQLPTRAFDIKTEDEANYLENKDETLNEIADLVDETPETSTPSKGKISSPSSGESQRGRKRKRVSEPKSYGTHSKLHKTIKQEILDLDLAKPQQKLTSPVVETRQRINGHRKSENMLGIRELHINLEKLGHKQLMEKAHSVKSELSPTRESAARTRITKPKEKQNALSSFTQTKSPKSPSSRRRTLEKVKESPPLSKAQAKSGKNKVKAVKQKSPKKSPALKVTSPRMGQKSALPHYIPKGLSRITYADDEAMELVAMDLELQQLRKKLMKEDVVKVDMVNFLKKNGKPSTLHEAVGANDYDIVKILSRAGVGVNALNSSLETPLHLAVRQNSISITSLLLECNSQIDPTNKDLQTPLHLAVLGQSVEIVKVLLQAGANHEMKDYAGYTPMHLAAKTGQIAIVEALVDSGTHLEALTEAGKTPLFLAAEMGHAEVCKVFAIIGCNAEARNNVNDTPLHAAALGNHVDAANVLLDVKVNVDAINDHKETPLHLAAWKDSLSVVQLLFQRGASLTLQDCSGLTPPQRANTESSKVKAWFREVGVHAIPNNTSP